MAADIANVAYLESKRRSELMLHREVPEVHQWDAIGVQGIGEVIDADAVGQRISTVRSHRRFRRSGRTVQKTERGDINVRLIDALDSTVMSLRFFR